MRELPIVRPEWRCDVTGESYVRNANTMFPTTVTRCAHAECWREWAPGSSPEKFVCGRFPQESRRQFDQMVAIAMENDR